MKQAIIIAIANQKGGVGKTTSTINIGAGLAQAGKKVLLVDLDAQANLTTGMGLNPEEIDDTISSLFSLIVQNDGELDEKIDPMQFIISTQESVDLLPSDINLAGVESSFQKVEMGREKLLQQILERISDQYDYIILDCPPSLGSITINSLTAANRVIIPMQASKFSFDGSKQLVRVISKVKKLYNPTLRIDGILVTMFDKRTNHAKDVLEGLNEIYGQNIRIFEHKISYSVRVSESNFEGKSIFSHDSKGKVAAAYQGCVEELING